MSEPEVKKKNKKKKKKSAKKQTVEENPPPQENKSSPDSTENGTVSINEVLPNKVGMTTVFKDVEVTMTHDGIVNTTTNTASKKKKKKKKSKQAAPEVVQEAKPGEDNSPANFIKFDKDRIELVNHPEISVTLSKVVPTEDKEPPKPDNSSIAVDKKDSSDVTVNSAGTKKKKKKKKKKKTPEESSLPSEQPNPESAETPYKAPTYVKLPAAGDSCVLVVSHESFSGDSKAPVNSETVTTTNTSTVLIKNKDKIEEPKGTAILTPTIQAEASITIFPVSSDQNPSDKVGGVTMDSNLQKVGELIKKEVKSNDLADSGKDAAAKSEEPVMTKAQLKAERRAKQEAQRAAKLAKSNEKNVSHPEGSSQTKNPTENSKLSLQVKLQADENTEASKPKSMSKLTPEKGMIRRFQIFSHLPQIKDLTPKQLSDANSKIHPAIIELGVHFNKGTICGSNARCVGFLGAFREVIEDYKTPPNKAFSRDLESKLKTCLNFLNNCRPLSVSITNAVRFLQHQINRIPKDSSEDEAKEKLYISINNFVTEEILLAKEAICMSATAKIVNGDNIIVYAYSSIVKDVLCKAHDQNKSFHVTVIDSGPKFEGLQMLHLLSKHGLQCAYKSIDSVCSVMKKASKVFIGAHALLLNGYVMSRLGCNQLALVASAYSVPVLVCCETYKFCDRSLSDSFVHNELGRPADLIKTCLSKNESLEDWQSLPSFQTCNILYDVTPSDLISVIITEKGLLPCSSVPVVLRVKYASLQE